MNETDCAALRRTMVDCQIRPADVTDYGIIEALLWAPRERFLPERLRPFAYADRDFRLPGGQVLLAPRTFAKMLQVARAGPSDMVLDLGCAYGYSAAVLSRLAEAVVALEPDAAVADEATAILADLGVSSMQLDNPDRGFSHRAHGPLDMRMNPTRGESASQLLTRVSEAELERLLTEHADEPRAGIIARVLKQQPIETTQAVDRLVRAGITAAFPNVAKPELKLSVRRTLQAIRIAVNDEFSALDWLLRTVPACLAPGGRVALLTFHSGEDRRVKKAFQAGHRVGVYADVAKTVIRPSKEETRANRRASSAKLRWAVRAQHVSPGRDSRIIRHVR